MKPLYILIAACLAVLPCGTAQALEYPYAPYNEGKMDPQKTGWPLTKEELDYVAKGSHLRRPGSESGAQKVEFLPYTPAADASGNPNWYVGIQEKFIKVIDQYKKDHGTDIDILLAGDSITWQWTDISAPYRHGRATSASARPSISALAATRPRGCCGGSTTVAPWARKPRD